MFNNCEEQRHCYFPIMTFTSKVLRHYCEKIYVTKVRGTFKVNNFKINHKNS